ncbi:MAG: hypothetical protein J7452_02190 [Thermoflexus sp.]|jgi:hypothetical protein|nr:hypothetical protein [Thermoflexus sp.]
MRSWVLLGGMVGLMLLAGCGAPAPARYAVDFGEGAPGWSLPQDPRFQARAEDGRLILTLKPARTVAWIFSPFTLREGQVEVEGTLLEGPSSADYGLVLGAGRGRLYRFAVSADGHYGIFVYEQGAWRTRVDWTSHEGVRTGRTTNRLQVRCERSEMVFWINGIEVARIPRDPREEGGRVGVSVGTAATGEAQVGFARFLAVRDR